jgi:putative Mg2+ transporter-C (MgtC) family protein
VDVLWREFAAGFSDWPQFGRVALRLLVAMVLGGIVGIERERAGRWAGLRTHMLVSLGSALLVISMTQLVDVESDDISRVVQGIATGIGFIGAGSILKLPDERQIEGLTTAAGIWVTAAVGITAGLGLLGTATLTVAFTWLVLKSVTFLEGRGTRDRRP